MTTETIRCRECGREIRFVRLGWGHVENPRQNHHYAVAGRSLEALLAKADVSGGADACWPWLGAVRRSGYGVSGDRDAHRVVYEHAVGSVPVGYHLDHVCHSTDTSCPGGSACAHRRCVNPSHLEPVTPRENTSRGRSFAPENAAKTHCPRGHSYGDSSMKCYRGRRYCRLCNNENSRTYRRSHPWARSASNANRPDRNPPPVRTPSSGQDAGTPSAALLTAGRPNDLSRTA